MDRVPQRPHGLGAEVDAVIAELAAERATTLTQLGERLDRALAHVHAVRAEAERPGADVAALVEAHDAAREALRVLRWEALVVREAIGLRNVRAELDRTWPMPPRWTG